MTIRNALAYIAVRDSKAAARWYEQLFDRAPDETPMEGLLEWRFPDGGWVQVFQDKERAGKSSVTLAVQGFDERLQDLKRKGIAIGPISDGAAVKTAIFHDPDGNQLVFAEGADEVHRSTG